MTSHKKANDNICHGLERILFFFSNRSFVFQNLRTWTENYNVMISCKLAHSKLTKWMVTIDNLQYVRTNSQMSLRRLEL